MSFEDFKTILDNERRVDDFINKAYDLNIDLTNADAIYTSPDLQQIICRLAYPKKANEAYDMLTWYIYELPDIKKSEPDEAHLMDADGNPIDISTDEKFYEFMEKEYGN